MEICLEIEFSCDAGGSENWSKHLRSNLAICSATANAHLYVIPRMSFLMLLGTLPGETLKYVHRKQEHEYS